MVIIFMYEVKRNQMKATLNMAIGFLLSYLICFFSFNEPLKVSIPLAPSKKQGALRK